MNSLQTRAFGLLRHTRGWYGAALALLVAYSYMGPDAYPRPKAHPDSQLPLMDADTAAAFSTLAESEELSRSLVINVLHAYPGTKQSHYVSRIRSLAGAAVTQGRHDGVRFPTEGLTVDFTRSTTCISRAELPALIGRSLPLVSEGAPIEIHAMSDSRLMYDYSYRREMPDRIRNANLSFRNGCLRSFWLWDRSTVDHLP